MGEPDVFVVGADTANAADDKPLLRALGLAHHWQRLLDEERVASVDEIAAAEGMDVSYIRRLLRLTLIAPKVIEQLAAGVSGKLENLLGQPLPLDWREQLMLLHGRES